MTRAGLRQGFLLLPVALGLALIATAAFLLTRETALDTELAAGSARADEARYVAEAGLQHALWQVNQADCSGYAELAATPFGAHSYSATVTPSEGSPVTIAATGTLANGASRTYERAQVRVYSNATTYRDEFNAISYAGNDTGQVPAAARR